MLGKLTEGNSLNVDQKWVQHRREKPRKRTRKREGPHNYTWQVCHTFEEYIHFNSLCISLCCITSDPKGLYFTFCILLCSNPIWHSNIKECIKSFSAQQNGLLQVSPADYAWNVSFTANNAIKLTYYAMCFFLFSNNTGRFFLSKTNSFDSLVYNICYYPRVWSYFITETHVSIKIFYTLKTHKSPISKWLFF